MWSRNGRYKREDFSYSVAKLIRFTIGRMRDRRPMLSLPPIYRPAEIGPEQDPFERARDAAARGDADGTFIWASRTDRAECAVVLAPDRPLAESCLAAPLTMLGIGEALGALIPPAVAVTYGWPDRIDVNGATAGGIRLAVGGSGKPQTMPEWMVTAVSLAVAGDPADASPGRTIDRTSLFEEGCGEVTARQFLESFARHFLHWLNRWQDDGFGPVRGAWNARASNIGEPVALDLGGALHAGISRGIDENGALLLEADGETERLDLLPALKAPTWSL